MSIRKSTGLQICSKILIHLHQFRNGFWFGVEPAPETVSFHNGTVVSLVSFSQLRRHRQIIIEVSKG